MKTYAEETQACYLFEEYLSYNENVFYRREKLIMVFNLRGTYFYCY